MGYEHREDAVRGGRNRQCQTHTRTHTHTVFPVIQRVDGASGKDRKQTCHTQAWPSLTKLLGYEHRVDAAGGGGVCNVKQTHTHTPTHRVTRDTQDGWSLGQGSDPILTHVSVALPLIKLMGYEHREVAVEGLGAGNGKHTQTHTQCPR